MLQATWENHTLWSWLLKLFLHAPQNDFSCSLKKFSCSRFPKLIFAQKHTLSLAFLSKQHTISLAFYVKTTPLMLAHPWYRIYSECPRGISATGQVEQCGPAVKIPDWFHFFSFCHFWKSKSESRNFETMESQSNSLALESKCWLESILTLLFN